MTSLVMSLRLEIWIVYRPSRPRTGSPLDCTSCCVAAKNFNVNLYNDLWLGSNDLIDRRRLVDYHKHMTH